MFTHDRAVTVDRVAEDYECDVVVVPDDVKDVKRVLVPIRSDVNIDRIITVVGTALDESNVSVTLFHAAPPEENSSVGDILLEHAVEELVEASVNRDRIETVNVNTESLVNEIVGATTDHDVIVIGETEPSLVEEILGDVPTRIIDQSGQPVLIVRNPE
ncbi:universal stress protein [Haladaptatus sp. NG-WS-4]